MQKFKVKRPHTGDREYSVGDVREANAADVRHLVPNVLEPMDGEKAEAAPSNKMEPEPSNKMAISQHDVSATATTETIQSPGRRSRRG
jgi:hypothetical protein